MADTEAVIFEPDALEAAAQQLAEQAGEELSGMLGVQVGLEGESLCAVAAGEVAEEDAPIVMLLCRAEGPPPTPIQLVVPRSLGALLAGLQLGRSLAEIDVEGKSSLDSEVLGALRGVMRVVLSALQQSLGEQLAGQVQIQDALEVDEPASDPTWLDGHHFLRLRFELEVEGAPRSLLDVLLPDHAGADREDDAGQAPREPRLVIVLDDDPDEAGVAALARELGCDVEACGLPELEEQGPEALSRAGAILVPWMLGDLPGIEALERLAPAAQQAETELVVVHPEPTRSMVLAALRAGASNFVMEIADLLPDETAADASDGAGEGAPDKENEEEES